ncbi:hypothetical protein [Altererythrobacter sp. MTPC7]|uniref:hypothetical protein n=1 Tax=Altererythrobacter sp. MTPC7 TaxID=3056567 RepID=UPI0036F20837
MTQSTELERTKSEPWRKPDGTFGPGNPGKPKGARHRFNKAVLDRLGGLTDKAMATLERKLDEGELKAATFVLARFLPSERVVDVAAEPHEIADAIGEGELTVQESNRLAQAVKTLKEAAGVDEMRARLDEIEALLTAQGRS